VIDSAVGSESGKAGTQELRGITPRPSSGQGPVRERCVNVAGAPKDSPTVPGKIFPTQWAASTAANHGQPARLDDVQRKIILESVRATKAPRNSATPKVSDALATRHWEASESRKRSVRNAALTNLKYVRLADKVLLIVPANHIVVDQIKI